MPAGSTSSGAKQIAWKTRASAWITPPWAADLVAVWPVSKQKVGVEFAVAATSSVIAGYGGTSCGSSCRSPRGEFPRRFNLTPRCVVGDLKEVEAWLEQRRQAYFEGRVKIAPEPDVHRRKSRPIRRTTANHRLRALECEIRTFRRPMHRRELTRC